MLPPGFVLTLRVGSRTLGCGHGGYQMGVKVKICGITNLDDALAAVAAGAEALGFVFYSRSSRRISLESAAQIVRKLPPFVAKVGVFVNESARAISRVAAGCGLDTVQLHGDEPPDFCRQFFPLKVIKAFRVQTAASLSVLASYDTDAWLLDSFVPGLPGGTGSRFDWQWACPAREEGRPIILAGGLTADNVAGAVRLMRPFAVDVSSGVERAPGKKEPAKMRDFIAAARGA